MKPIGKPNRQPLAYLPFLQHLPAEQLNELASCIKTRHFSRNQVILQADETDRYMYIITTGTVKVVQSSDKGKESILAIHKRGDFFGEMGILDGQTSPATVIALEETTLALISKADFHDLFLADPAISRQIITFLCGRLRDSWLMQRVQSSGNAEERVVALLRHMAERHGVQDQRGTILTMRLTHQEIAEFVSLSRETVSRLMTRLVQNGTIEILPGRKILLNKSFNI